MKKINIFILAFILFCMVVVQSILFFVRTKKFASLLTQEINKTIGEVASLQIKKFDITVFPLSTDVYGLVVRDVRGNSIEAQKIRFELGLKDLFSKNLTFSEIVVDEAKIYLNKELINGESRVSFSELLDKVNKIKLSYIYELLNTTVNKIPFEINKVSINNSTVSSLDLQQEVGEITITKHKKKLKAKVRLTNVDLSKYISESTDLLDEGSISAIISTDDFVLEELKLVTGLTSANFNGLVRNHENNLFIQGSGSANLDLQQVAFLLPELNPISGIISTDLIFNGPLKKLEADFKIKGADIVTKWCDLKGLESSIEFKNEYLKITSFVAKMDKGNVRLARPFNLFDNKKRHFENIDISVSLDHVFTNQLFTFVPDLKGLKGYITGDIDLKVNQGLLIIKGKESLVLDEFQLQNKKTGEEILKNKNRINLEDFSIDINLEKFKLNLTTNLKFKESSLIVKGFIDHDELDFKILPGSKINFFEFGPIVKKEIRGYGPIEGRISGDLDNVIIDLEPTLQEMNVLEFDLGNVRTHLDLALKDLVLTIHNLVSQKQNTKLSGSGELDFEKSLVRLNVKMSEANLLTTKSILHPILKNINTDDIRDFDLQLDAKITGGLDIEKLNVDGKYSSRYLSLTQEDFTDVTGNLHFEEMKLDSKKIQAKKGPGKINGNVFVDIKNNYLEYDFSAAEVKLSDLKMYKNFPIAYDGVITGEFFGSGRPDDLSGRNLIDIKNANIANYPVQSSKLVYFFNKGQKSLTANLLGGEVNVALELNDSKFTKAKSKLDLTINTNDIKKIFSSFSEHNMENKSLNGKMRASLKTIFDYDNLTKDLWLELDVNNFEINSGASHYYIESPKQIKIKNSQVEVWNFAINSNGDQLATNGIGNLERDFSMNVKGSIDAGILSLAIDQIKSATGRIAIDYSARISKDISSTLGKISLQKTSLGFRNIPVDCKNLNADFNINGNKFIVDKFTSEMGGGTMSIKGEGLLKAPYPQLKLKTFMDGIKIPLFEKSYIVVSGQGDLIGDRLPYFYNANLLLLHGEILDEFDEIGKSDKSKFDRKYIPTNRTNVQKSLINYSIQSEILRSIKVKNSITDLEMNGKIYLFGDLQNPRLNGSVQSSILNSKFVFKGHEFFITYGKIDFISELQDRGPLLNFIAQSTVESYKVKLAVYGHVADMSIDLTSTPALSQQDILSLLTLGITSSDSSKLQEDERSYLTSVGIGSLLADRFKINQGLKSSLGLNFSIAPELTQSGESLLPTQGKTSTSTSQYKSATKLKVQKKVNDLVDVSVSSTVGSTQGQKQELNVNLNLSQTVSVQGVYEVKSSNEETTQQSPGSLGLDLLFRKTFK